MNVMPVRLELFGSFATGTAASTSDIDFVVYGSELLVKWVLLKISGQEAGVQVVLIK